MQARCGLRRGRHKRPALLPSGRGTASVIQCRRVSGDSSAVSSNRAQPGAPHSSLTATPGIQNLQFAMTGTGSAQTTWEMPFNLSFCGVMGNNPSALTWEDTFQRSPTAAPPNTESGVMSGYEVLAW